MTTSSKLPVKMSDEDFEHFKRMKSDPWYYIATSVKTWDEHEKNILLKQSKPFPRYPYLRDFVRETTRNRAVVVNKSRQLTLSWALCALATHEILFKLHARVLMISMTQEDSYALRDRCRHIFQNLPWNVQLEEREEDVPDPEKLVKDKASVMAVEGGSEIVFLPQSRSAGRGYPATLVICDEFAFWMWADEIYTGIVPTLSGGDARIIISSTPNGVGNKHCELCQGAAGRGFKYIKIHYSQHPGRDPATTEGRVWVAQQKLLLSDREFAQEHDCQFLQSGNCVFDQGHVKRKCLPMPDRVVRYKTAAALKMGIHSPWLTGVDVAEGHDGGDYSVATVIEKATGRQVRTLRARTKPEIFARMMKRYILDPFPIGPVGVEKNGPGGTLILALEKIGFRDRLYRHREYDQRGKLKTRVGWVTSSKSKSIMIDEYEEGLRKEDILLSHHDTLAETLVYEYKEGKEHSGAPGGYHDDTVIAVAIAWQMRKGFGPTVRSHG
jgi:hypothetical protein